MRNQINTTVVLGLILTMAARAETISSISTFASGTTPTVNATGPDSITVGGGSVWVVGRFDQLHCAKRQVVKDGLALPDSQLLRRVGSETKVFIHVESRYTRQSTPMLG